MLMSGVFSILISLLVFSILVLVHEFGHYYTAVKNGILVEEFAIGMGPVVCRVKRGETDFTIRALPLGGFCRMLGEDGESDNRRAFSNKNVWQRIVVIISGPLMNFVFAFIAVFFVTSTAEAIVFPTVSSVLEDSNAAVSGLEEGDRIIKVNGENIGTYQELFLVLDGCGGKTLDVVVDRGGEKVQMYIDPVVSSDSRWIIGFSPQVKTGLFSEKVSGYDSMTLGEAVADTFYTMRFYVKSVVVGFVRIFTLNISPEEIAGPIGVVEIMGESVQQGLEYSFMDAVRNVLTIAALLSTNLGVINLFPIPAMDGGRLVFLIIEAIRRKPIAPEREGMIHFMGFVLLMAFMVMIAYNDISRIIFG